LAYQEVTFARMALRSLGLASTTMTTKTNKFDKNATKNGAPGGTGFAVEVNESTMSEPSPDGRSADTPAPVMVGIDGSKPSLRAAVWAIDEAIARDTVLRLVYVVNPVRGEDLDDAMADARHALHHAWETVADTGKPVKLESEILRGEPAEELVHASQRAGLLCVGRRGAKDSGSHERGTTARAVARRAHCSTAVVRRRGASLRPRSHRWIIAVLDESAESHAVLETAIEEASTHEAPVLALTSWSTTTMPREGRKVADRSMREQLHRHLERAWRDPGALQMCALPMPHDLLHLLKQTGGIEQMVIVGERQQQLIEELTSRRGHAALHKSSCSLLIVRSAQAIAGPTAPMSYARGQ
jgi:nucleotide-binding universal stress UspA family protein